MSAILNFPECRELNKIRARKFFLPDPELKFARSKKIWDNLAADSQVRNQILQQEECVVDITRMIEDMENEMRLRRLLLKRMVLLKWYR